MRSLHANDFDDRTTPWCSGTMKFKLAFKHRGLCETGLVEGTYEDFRSKGLKSTQERGMDEGPDFFIEQRGRWWKLDELDEICGVEFSAADYTDGAENEEMV